MHSSLWTALQWGAAAIESRAWVRWTLREGHEGGEEIPGFVHSVSSFRAGISHAPES
eukprot:GDKH01000297.1.p2 GENE.GDKH01000297.1~~GDKH01000297.1.p2  ORF type:complete len:57 (+),score=3.30 GDKH01000297.1:95-265(+)